MKTLLILRHAKSSWKDEGLTDFDRPLNGRGQRDAPRMGTLLREHDLIPDKILSSNAVRARSTALLAAEAAGFKGDLELTADFYLAPPATYLQRLAMLPEEVGRVMVVGHNPGLEELVAHLTGTDDPFPTAALAKVNLPIESWSELTPTTEGELDGLWLPKEMD